MLCNKMKSRLKKLLGAFDNYVETHIDAALALTANLKKAVSSPLADLLTAIIPGDIDNEIRTKLVAGLGDALDMLAIVKTCKDHTDTGEKLQCFASQLAQQDPNLQDALLVKLASLLAGFLDGNRLKQYIYDLYTQARYSAGK